MKIYDLCRHPNPWVDRWVNGWAHVKSLNQINLDLIEINQLWTFLTFFDILLKPPQPLMGLFFVLCDDFIAYAYFAEIAEFVWFLKGSHVTYQIALNDQ